MPIVNLIKEYQDRQPKQMLTFDPMSQLRELLKIDKAAIKTIQEYDAQSAQNNNDVTLLRRQKIDAKSTHDRLKSDTQKLKNIRDPKRRAWEQLFWMIGHQPKEHIAGNNSGSGINWRTKQPAAPGTSRTKRAIGSTVNFMGNVLRNIDPKEVVIFGLLGLSYLQSRKKEAKPEDGNDNKKSSFTTDQLEKVIEKNTATDKIKSDPAVKKKTEDFYKKSTDSASDAAKEKLAEVESQVVTGTLHEEMDEAAQNVSDKAKTFGLGDILKRMVEFVKTAFGKIVDYFSDQFNRAMDAFMNSFGGKKTADGTPSGSGSGGTTPTNPVATPSDSNSSSSTKETTTIGSSSPNTINLKSQFDDSTIQAKNDNWMSGVSKPSGSSSPTPLAKPSPTADIDAKPLSEVLTGKMKPTDVAVDKALQLQGMHEVRDRNTIKEYLRTGGVGMDPATTAWCAATVNSSLAQAGIKGSGSQVANSFQTWGSAVDPSKGVQKGDVIVQTHGLGPGQTGGHVGFATGKIDPKTGKIEMFAGNDNDRAQARMIIPDRNTIIRRATARELPKETQDDNSVNSTGQSSNGNGGSGGGGNNSQTYDKPAPWPEAKSEQPVSETPPPADAVEQRDGGDKDKSSDAGDSSGGSSSKSASSSDSGGDDLGEFAMNMDDIGYAAVNYG